MLGQTEPHWSVVTLPEYRAVSIAEHNDEFYDARRSGVPALKAIFARNSETLTGIQSCLELGCGVGRTTAALAQLLRKIVAVDISPHHLTIARDHVGRAGLTNVEWRQLRAIDDISSFPRFDLFFSELVLQYNPPPVIVVMLKQLFDVKSYLGSRLPPEQHDLERSIEMHVVPQRVVHRLMRDAGIELIEVVEDELAGLPQFQSMTFFGRKRSPMRFE